MDAFRRMETNYSAGIGSLPRKARIGRNSDSVFHRMWNAPFQRYEL